jgi:hypothetical protein
MPTLASSWPTAVASLGPVSVGSQRWKTKGRDYLTAIVKARFALRPNSSMVLAGRPPLAIRDVHLEDDPTRSVVEASDIVPHRERADVWLRGTARALGNKPVSVSVARLAVYRAGVVMVDRTIHVLGDRPHADANPMPFMEMPLVWERAYGGVGFDANPVGVGADERMSLPNLIDPSDPEAPACFAPISRYWRSRRGGISTADRRLVESPSPQIPDAFDWGYYQAAPRSQQLTYLHGDEWLVLDGFHQDRLRIQSRLPKVRGLARLMPIDDTGADRGDAIAMVADTWAIDADEQTCTITWRGAISFSPDRDPAQLLVAGGVELPGQTVRWAQAYGRVQRTATPPRGMSAMVDHSAAMTIISDAPAQSARAEITTDDPLASTTVDPPRPGAPFVAPPSRPIESWPSYPLASDAEEVTETRTEITDLDTEDPQDVTAPQRLPSMATDTEPGGPPVLDPDDMPWVREVPVEPDPRVSITSRRSESLSLPPAPLDEIAYAAALRKAGATEHDVAILINALRKDRESGR